MATGGGLYAQNARIEDSTFLSNDSYNGGAAFLTRATQIERSSFVDNYSGGGVLVVSGLGDEFMIDRSLFLGNEVSGDYIGIVDVTGMSGKITNTAFVDSIARGGAMIRLRGSGSETEPFLLDHLTINGARGTLEELAGVKALYSSWVSMTNSIIANFDLENGLYAYLSNVHLDHVLWHNNAIDISGSGITNQNPLYGDPLFGDDGYHLTAASPAIGSGVLTTTIQDIDGDLRDNLPDLGADEYRLHLFMPLLRR